MKDSNKQKQMEQYSKKAEWTQQVEQLAIDLNLDLLRDDPNYDISRHGKVIWRCKKHKYMKPYSNPTAFIAADGKPAYATYTKNFIKKQICCGVGQEERARAEGYQILLDRLKERGKTYNTVYTLVNIKSAEEYSNKRGLRIVVFCEKHQVTTTFSSAETLIRHTAFPCSVCRQEKENFGKLDEKLKKTYAAKDESARKAFRLDAVNIWGERCMLTKTSFTQQGSLYLDAHHLNSSNTYPELKKQAKNNSIILMTPIHQAFHFDFLKNRKFHDDITKKCVFKDVANLLTFKLFLQQLKREILNKSQNGYINYLKPQLKEFWQRALIANATKSPEPEIDLVCVEETLNIINNQDHLNLFNSFPQTKFFLEDFVETSAP